MSENERRNRKVSDDVETTVE